MFILYIFTLNYMYCNYFSSKSQLSLFIFSKIKPMHSNLKKNLKNVYHYILFEKKNKLKSVKISFDKNPLK